MSAAEITTIIAALSSLLTAYLANHNRAKIKEVHVLVNSQLDEVVKRLKSVTQERDALVQEKEELEGEQHGTSSSN